MRSVPNTLPCQISKLWKCFLFFLLFLIFLKKNEENLLKKLFDKNGPNGPKM